MIIRSTHGTNGKDNHSPERPEGVIIEEIEVCKEVYDVINTMNQKLGYTNNHDTAVQLLLTELIPPMEIRL